MLGNPHTSHLISSLDYYRVQILLIDACGYQIGLTIEKI